jgi:hypothetical protein
MTVSLIINGRGENFNCFLSKNFKGEKIFRGRGGSAGPGPRKEQSLLIFAVHIPD